MINQVKEFVTEFYKTHQPFDDVLDVGSLDVNGSIKEVLEKCGFNGSFVGTDMRGGKGVDKVLNGHLLDTVWDKPTFDLITCCDTLEHDDRFWLTVEQMRKVLKPNGWLLITVPSFSHPRHNHPSDYYRFLETALKDVFFEGYLDVITQTMQWSSGADDNKPDEILGYGRKPNDN